MKRISIDAIAAFGAAVVCYRCTELGLNVYAAIAAGTSVGACISYALRTLFRQKRRRRVYRRRIYRRVGCHAAEADEHTQPEHKQTVTLKGAILKRAPKDEPRVVAECCICNRDIYRGQEYYSNCEVAMCVACYTEFGRYDD